MENKIKKRVSSVHRKTNETDIIVKVNLMFLKAKVPSLITEEI